nr:M15 family metallopeptidase [Cellulomonas sp. RIT-PI-Y]
MRRAVYSAYGWYPVPTGISDAYRSYAVQQSIFLDRYQTTYTQYTTGKVDRREWNGIAYYRTRGQAAAAVPGTSNHGLGITVDITGLGGFEGTRYKQLAAVAVPLGWSNTEGRKVNEAWHWSYTGPVELTSNDTSASTGTIPTVPDLIAPTPPREWDEMASQDEIRALIQTENAELIRQVTEQLAELKRASAFIASGPLKPNGQDDYVPGVRHFYACEPATMTRRHLSSQSALARARERLPETTDRQSADWLRAFTLVK